MKIDADTLTIDMVHEHFPGAFTNPTTVDLETLLDCSRAVGCLSTTPDLRRQARARIAAAINAKIGA